MKPNMKLSLVPVCFVLVLSACANNPSNAPSSSGGLAQSAATGEVPGGAPFLPFSGLASIPLLTPSSGVGAKPHFEWSPVDGAAQYSLFVQFADGRPYWSWIGSSTSVYLGGADSPQPEDAAGPILQDGMSWSVIAFDSQGNVIATSVLQPISP